MASNFDTSKLNDGTYLMVKNGCVEDMGYAFTSLTGYTKSDFYLKSISEVTHKLFGYDLDLERNKVSDCFLFTKSFEVIEVLIRVYKIGRGDNKLYLFKQKINFVLNSELSFVDKLLKDNNMGVGLYSSPELRLLKANQEYLEYIQDVYLAEGNPISLCFDKINTNFIGSKKQNQLLNVSETGETVYLKEQQIISRNGDYRYFNKSYTPIAEDGKVKYIIAILDDVTDNTLEKKHMEEQNAELKKMIEMKDEMLMLISHELKTPLAIITSSIQTLELVCKNELSEKLRKYLNKIKQNTYRQLKLVNNILDNTRVNSGLFRMNRICVDISLLTRTIIDSIAVFAERKGIKISFSNSMTHPIIYTDVDIYERILLNLLSNAVKFTPEGKSIEVSIFQMLSKGIQQVCIQVKDNGIGIPNDQKELIFERFGRVDRIVTRHSEGTGIGLYLVKMLVSLLDGDIKLESKEGVGSTFTLIFPLIKSCKISVDPARIENPSEQLITASAIEFSDIYYGA